MTITSIFQDGCRDVTILLPISYLVTSLNEESRNLPAYQISITFRNSLLRYYYFRFGNKRPPCWNSAPGFDFHVCITIGMSFCISLPWAGLSAVELWRHSYFQDGGHQPCWILSRVIADHPRSTKEGHRRRKGGKETCAPGGTVQRSAFGGAKIWNYEIWSFLSNCICIADSDISHP